MTLKEWLIGLVTLKWVVTLHNFNKQGLPKFQYLGADSKNLVQVKHGGAVVTLFNAYYCTVHGSYIYWALLEGCVDKTKAVPILETYLETYQHEAVK